MTIEKTEFEFPDEIEAKQNRLNAPEIEIVDDTPEEDRNRSPMKEEPKDFADDELEKYDESVKNRIKHFTKGYHEERRAKEAAQREREEAVLIAQNIANENRNLKGSLNQGQNALLEQAKRNVAGEMAEIKRKYKEAYESGDSDGLVEAQDQMTTIRMKSDRVNNFKPIEVPVEAPNVVQNQQMPIDQKALAWKNKNEWFGSNRKMTAYALAVHEDLVQNDKVDPASDDYYNRLGNEMRERFPDEFESGKSGDASTPRQKSNVVAPATRNTAPRKIVLSQTQVNIAKRLNVPLELYARKVAEEMRK